MDVALFLFAIANLSIGARDSKSAFSELTIYIFLSELPLS